MTIFSRHQLIKWFQDQKREPISEVMPEKNIVIKANYDGKAIWEYNDSNGKVTFSDPNNDNNITVIDLCGKSSLMTSLSGGKDEINVNSHRWEEYFKSWTSNQTLIPDTNFILRHYSSNVLRRKLGEEIFKSLKFRLPRLVILELERLGNQEKDDEETRLDKRLAFYAIKEIDYLKKNTQFDLLPEIEVSLIESFTEKAGRRFTDIWIRREIQNAFHHNYQTTGWAEQLMSQNTIFLTCDLMNALAAEAEGLRTCFFSRLEPTETDLIIDNEDSEELFALTLATVIVYDKISFEVSTYKGSKSYSLRGMWKGKTTSQWFYDSIDLEPM